MQVLLKVDLIKWQCHKLHHAGEIFEYSVKFLNGVPVAIDGNATITNFDAAD